MTKEYVGLLSTEVLNLVKHHTKYIINLHIDIDIVLEIVKASLLPFKRLFHSLWPTIQLENSGLDLAGYTSSLQLIYSALL